MWKLALRRQGAVQPAVAASQRVICRASSSSTLARPSLVQALLKATAGPNGGHSLVRAATASAVACGTCTLIMRQQRRTQLQLLRPEPAQCESLIMPSNNLVRSIKSMSEDEGYLRTLLRIVFRCFELLAMLTPTLVTLPLFKTPLRAQWLKLLVSTLERCGPVGIKWGQWASTRYDIFEDDLCDALGALTNAAPVHARAWTDQVVQEELGQTIERLFVDFSPQPIASGSIGQVHTATLREAHGPFPAGTKVAVKVQHPGLANRLGIDMAILMGAADSLGSIKGFHINETVAQFASNFYQQLDFRDEAENLRRFSRHFGSSFWRAIVSFPKPVDDLVSQHVVVETFEKGESVADYLHKAGDSPKVTKWKREGSTWVPLDASQSVENIVSDGDDLELRKKVALCGVQSYLKMLMVDNFIHADLHPGNVLVRMEEVGWWARLQRYILIGQSASSDRVPHIVFLDAGLAANFDDRIYSSVQTFFSAIINFDGPGFAKSILGLAPTQPHVKSPDDFIAEVSEKMIEMRQEMLDGEGRAGDNIRSFMASVRKHHVTLDPTVMVALMSMMVLEGWQVRAAPRAHTRRRHGTRRRPRPHPHTARARGWAAPAKLARARAPRSFDLGGSNSHGPCELLRAACCANSLRLGGLGGGVGSTGPGGQFRLDPGVSIVGSIETQLNRRTSILGMLL